MLILWCIGVRDEYGCYFWNFFRKFDCGFECGFWSVMIMVVEVRGGSEGFWEGEVEYEYGVGFM